MKRSDAKGDLYLVVDIEFPEDGWIKDEAALQQIRQLLPARTKTEESVPEEVEEVEYDLDADLEEFGAGSGDPRAGNEWEDEDEETGGPQCAAQ